MSNGCFSPMSFVSANVFFIVLTTPLAASSTLLSLRENNAIWLFLMPFIGVMTGLFLKMSSNAMMCCYVLVFCFKLFLNLALNYFKTRFLFGIMARHC